MAGSDLVRVPPRIRRANAAALGVPDLRDVAEVELAIVAEIHGSRVRDFGNYLRLVDRLYGRLDPKGLRSYAQRKPDQLEIAEARSGSVELVVFAGHDLISQENLVFLWTLLSALATAGLAISYLVRNYADAYESYEQGRLARAQRHQIEGSGRAPSRQAVATVRREIREFLTSDPRFQDINRNRRAEIARHLADAYLADADQVRSIHEFAEQNVQSVVLRIDGREV